MFDVKGKNKATCKALSSLVSFMFEQEYGELENFNIQEIEILKKAKEVLSKHCN